MAEILTPNSDRWRTFVEILEDVVQAEGCDGDRHQAGQGKQHRLAKRTMAAMGDVDVPGSITYFEAHGGYCDCEILMNVDPDIHGQLSGRDVTHGKASLERAALSSRSMAQAERKPKRAGKGKPTWT